MTTAKPLTESVSPTPASAAKMAVVITKWNGSRVVFCTRPTEHEALRVVAQLAAVGLLGAKVERARRDDIAGTTRR